MAMAAPPIYFFLLLFLPIVVFSKLYEISPNYYQSGNSTRIGYKEYHLAFNGESVIASENKRFVLEGLISKNPSLLLVHGDPVTSATSAVSVWKFIDSLQYEDWISVNSAPNSKLTAIEITDVGNLIFHTGRGSLKHESFGNPADTLLPDQVLSTGMRLSSDRFSAVVVDDGILFMELQNVLQVWRLKLECNSSQTLVRYTGTQLQISNRCQTFSLTTTSRRTSQPSLPFLRLDSKSGELLSYAYDPKRNVWTEDVRLDLLCGAEKQNVKDPLNRTCQSGQYAVCNSNRSCKCLEDTRGNDSCLSSSGSFSHYFIKYILDDPHIESFRKFHKDSEEDCQNVCLRASCSVCVAILYNNSSKECIFIPSSNRSLEFSITKPLVPVDPFDRFILVLVIPVTVAGFWTLTILLLAISGQQLKFNPVKEIEDLLDSMHGLPQRFTYASLSIATKGFSEKLGSGGCGSVYKGVLSDGRSVAVKKIDSAAGTKAAKQFVTEVAGIGGISHVNVVKLCGFCLEAAKECLLVYDLMPNGSLDRWLFEYHQVTLSWQQRVDIALGTAQGLLYLHEESRESVLHLDIKPQNILLDEKFTAKLGDFGMAKVLKDREVTQVQTGMRGTPGYMAPEWLTHLTATKKSDVFSYGMVLLELVGGRRSVDTSKIKVNDLDYRRSEEISRELKREDWYFPAWVMNQVQKGSFLDVVDEKVRATARESVQQVKMMIQLALWCIQDNPSVRPPMHTIVQVLQGHLELGPAPLSPALSGTTIQWVSSLKSGSSSYFDCQNIEE